MRFVGGPQGSRRADDQGVKLRPRMAPNVSGERVDLSQQKVSCTNLLIFEPTHEAPSVRVKARVTSSLGGIHCHEYLIEDG